MWGWIIGAVVLYLATRQDPKAEGGDEFVGPPSSLAGGGASDGVPPGSSPGSSVAYGPPASDERRVWLLVGDEIAAGRDSVTRACARVDVNVVLLATRKDGKDTWMQVRILDENLPAALKRLDSSKDFYAGGGIVGGTFEGYTS